MFSKLCSFQAIFRRKPPIFSKFWAQGPPEVKTPLPPWPKSWIHRAEFRFAKGEAAFLHDLIRTHFSRIFVRIKRFFDLASICILGPLVIFDRVTWRYLYIRIFFHPGTFHCVIILLLSTVRQVHVSTRYLFFPFSLLKIFFQVNLLSWWWKILQSCSEDVAVRIENWEPKFGGDVELVTFE